MKTNKQKGQAILEFAVILPVFVLISLGLIDIQWSLERAANLDYIVNEVARCQAIGGNVCTGANTPKTYADLLAVNLGMDTRALKLLSSGCSYMLCSATMTFQYKPVGAWFPSLTIQRTGMAAAVPDLPPIGK